MNILSPLKIPSSRLGLQLAMLGLAFLPLTLSAQNAPDATNGASAATPAAGNTWTNAPTDTSNMTNASPADLAPPVADLPVAISANDPALRFVGRFHQDSSTGASCSWSNSTVQVRFNGTALNVQFNEKGKDFWQVIVDGTPGNILRLLPGQHTYAAVADLPAGEHAVDLVKRTEPMVGVSTLTGLQLSEGGTLLPVAAPSPVRHLEVVGDSISCGYGNEDIPQHHFNPATENGTLTYGALAAKAVGADYFCIAWSGQKMWPGRYIAEQYPRTVPKGPEGKWDFSQWVPDVVVINLGANDFASQKANPDQASWVGAYEAFITDLRTQAPNAVIYCALNPMTGNNWPPGHGARTAQTAYLNQIVSDFQAKGDMKVHYLEFAHITAHGMGGDGHPSLGTHRIMADALLDALAKDPGWTAAPGLTPTP